MDTTTFLAQFLGALLIVKGLFLLMRRDAVEHVMREVFEHRVLNYALGMLAVIAGITLVLMHNVWDGTWRVVVSILAWATLVTGLVALFFPQTLSDFASSFKERQTYNVWSAVAILLGAFLLIKSVGL